MATSLVLKRLTSEIPTIVVVGQGVVTAYGVGLMDARAHTEVTYNSNALRPFNVRGLADTTQEGEVGLYGKRTSLELIPIVPGNTERIIIRRGVKLPISII